jgi:hypothetical protein
MPYIESEMSLETPWHPVEWNLKAFMALKKVSVTIMPKACC